jgi:erythromycin esterase-like protein
MKFAAQFLALTATIVISFESAASLPANVYSYDGNAWKDQDGFEDLKPFSKIVGDASVVGLGEGIHTSGGYYEAKTRLIRYLVERRGFRVLAMETPRLQAAPAAKYIARCEGDPTDAVRSIFPVFSSTSVLRLFKWLCQFNQSHPNDPVQFLGFDVQEAALQMEDIQSRLEQLNLTKSNEFIRSLKLCNGAGQANSPGPWAPITAANKASCQAAIDTIISELKAQNLFSVDLELSLRGLRAFEEQFYFVTANPPDYVNSFAPRDQAMAETFLSMRKVSFSKQKSIVWAHNVHLQRAGDRINSPDLGSVKAVDFGEILSSTLGKYFRSIGLISYKTSTNWPEDYSVASCKDLPPPIAKKSAEVMLKRLDLPYLLVDLGAMKTGQNPFFAPDGKYQYGPNKNVIPGKIVEQFDGLVYLETSPAMDSVVFGSCARH